jgi:hypothetical protein
MVDYYNEHQREYEERQSQVSESTKYKQHDAYREFKQRVWVGCHHF